MFNLFVINVIDQSCILSQAIMTLLGQYEPVHGDQQEVHLTRQPEGRMMVYSSKRSSLFELELLGRTRAHAQSCF